MSRRVEVLRGQCAGQRGEVTRDGGDVVSVRLDGDATGAVHVYGADNVRNVDES